MMVHSLSFMFPFTLSLQMLAWEWCTKWHSMGYHSFYHIRQYIICSAHWLSGVVWDFWWNPEFKKNVASEIRWNQIFSDWGDESSFQVRTKEWVLCKWPSKGDFHGKIRSKISSSNRYTDLVSFCTRIMGAAKRSCMYSRAIFHFHDIGEEEYNIEFTFFEPWHIRWKYVKVPRS